MIPDLNLSPSNVDTFKGLLIVFIVVGHNTLLTSSVPYLSRILYAFHVFSFLFLPFLFRAQRLRMRTTIDRSVRYLVPYASFFILTSVLYYMIYCHGQGLGAWLVDAIIAFFVASTSTLDKACGFQLYWFLPALLTLVLTRSLMVSLPRSVALGFAFGFLVLHFYIGLLPTSIKKYAPIGLPIIAYIFPLGVFASYFWAHVGSKRPFVVSLLAFLVFVACIPVMIILGSRVNLATLSLYSYRNIPLMLLHDLIAISGFVAGLGFSAFLARLPLLSMLGKKSLLIYLSHSIFYQVLLQAAQMLHWIPSDNLSQILAGLFLVVLVVSLSLLLSELISRSTCIRRWLLPRSLDDWRGVQ